MTTTELLDQAAALIRDSKRVAIVAADTRQRELLRKGLRQRLEAEQLPSAHLAALGASSATGQPFDEVLVTAEALEGAKALELAWLAGIGWKAPLAPE